MRVVFTDYVYREVDGAVHGERAFALFLAALSEHCEVTIVGRLDPSPGPAYYPLPAGVRFIPLPHYKALTPRSLSRRIAGTLSEPFLASAEYRRCRVDLGSIPHSVAFALLTRARGRPLVLGVRQDFPSYVRSRRPGRAWMHFAADALELSWRFLARGSPVVVVGQSSPATTCMPRRS